MIIIIVTAVETSNLTKTENISEQGTEGNIWIQGVNNKRLEKTS
jgi:hypothetical protein